VKESGLFEGVGEDASDERSVLIVDDDVGARAALAQCLRDALWRVRTADHHAQAESLARALIPDCLVSEQKVDDGSGFELFARLRKLNPALRAIILTRHPSIAAAVHAIRIGFQDYLIKPIEPRRVAARLEQAATPAVGARGGAVGDAFAAAEPASLARVEWQYINSVLFGCDGNVSEAARVLAPAPTVSSAQAAEGRAARAPVVAGRRARAPREALVGAHLDAQILEVQRREAANATD
jgi:ActR/RegA family two-component response regulator